MRLLGGPDQTWGEFHVIRSVAPYGFVRVKELLWVAWQAGWAVGVDTETIGCNPASPEPEGCPLLSADIRVMTLGIPGPELGARGQRLAHRVLVTRDALPAFRVWLASQAPKAVSNRAYDAAAFRRAGYELNGVVMDTQERVRVLDPAARRGLKVRMVMDLGYQPVGEYTELFARPIMSTKLETFRFECPNWRQPGDPPLGTDCETEGCKRNKKWGPGYWHALKREVQVPLKTTEMIPIEELLDPAHPKHKIFLDYATLDAKATAELVSLPWPEQAPAGSSRLRLPDRWPPAPQWPPASWPGVPYKLTEVP